MDESNRGETRVISDRLVLGKKIALGSNGAVVYEGTYGGRPAAVRRLVRDIYDVAYEKIYNLIASNNHPNIVRLYGWEQDLYFIYLALEHCDCSLYEFVLFKMRPELWRPNGYPSPDLLKLMRDIVAGLAHLHALGIVHRDLKPHNVLIAKGRGLCCKLSTGYNALSRGYHDQDLGTSRWRAPEQILREQETQASDVFSLGCILFFCLTQGDHPFGGYFKREINVVRNKVNLFFVNHIPEAMDLFPLLLNSEPERRPNASDVLLHPLFWNSEARMLFLRDASDRVELEDEKVGSKVLEALERKGRVVFFGTWDDELDPAFLSQMTQHREYRYDMVVELLFIIRNTVNHYQELPTNIKDLLGAMPEGVDDYFRSRFPKLLMEVYNVMHHHHSQEEWFRKYLET